MKTEYFPICKQLTLNLDNFFVKIIIEFEPSPKKSYYKLLEVNSGIQNKQMFEVYLYNPNIDSTYSFKSPIENVFQNNFYFKIDLNESSIPIGLETNLIRNTF